MDEFKVPQIVHTKYMKPVADNEPMQSNELSEPDISKTTIAAAPFPIPIHKHSKTQMCPYMAPKWSGTPNPNLIYSFEVLKSGQIVDTINDLQSRSFWSIGKLSDNHITMAHPTISRYHAILQYRPSITKPTTDEDEHNDDTVEDKLESQKDVIIDSESSIEQGWYLFDLNSTHGTFLNKMRIPPKTYVRLRVGYMIKFGASTRNFILQGPEFDEEAESELTVTEIKEQRRQKEAERLAKLEEEEKRKEAEGISWGMTDDADEETDLSVNPFATTNNEELFINDPKKTLRGYFEREGQDLEYKVDEMSSGTYVCRVELPITDSLGRPIIAEVCHKGKKKECVLQCALEACRILDRHGVLRQANHEPMKRKINNSDSDDDDDFWDRTGDVERKRKRKEESTSKKAMTYTELLDKEQELLTKLSELEARIENYQEMEKLSKGKSSTADEDLDDFVKNLSKEKQLDKSEIRKIRYEIQRTNNDHIKLKKLISIARPIDLPPLNTDPAIPIAERKKVVLPLFGKKSAKGVAISKKPTSMTLFTDLKTHKSDEEKIEQTIETYRGSEEGVEITMQPTLQRDQPDKSVSIDGFSEPDKQCVSQTPEEKIVQPPVINFEIVSTNKKRKNRPRIRSDRYRENVDITDVDEFIDPEKHSEWIPPENQSGDGYTNLNDKFGY